MVNIDVNSGVATFTPPVMVAGEVATRVMGLSLNEWFYVAAIISMVISTGVSTYIAVHRAHKQRQKGDCDHDHNES